MQHQIFLSYCRRDAAIAEAFYHAASARNLSVWYDKMIPAGRDWRESIVEALGTCDVLLILFSSDSNKSTQIIKEVGIADRTGKMVIPVLIEEVEPTGAYLYEMASRNWINLYPEPISRVEALANRLAEQLGVPPKLVAPTQVSAPGGLAQAAPAAARPPEPIAKLQPAVAPLPPTGAASASPIAKPAELGTVGTGEDSSSLPVKPMDFYVLIPLLTLGFAGMLAMGGLTIDVFRLSTTALLVSYTFLVAVRAARSNLSILSMKSFSIYAGIVLLWAFMMILTEALTLNLVTNWKDTIVILLGYSLVVPTLANILQFVLRKIFQRSIFKSRIGAPLAAK